MTIQLDNYTPFPNLRYSGTDTDNLEFGVFMVKVAWDLLVDGSCAISAEQEPFVFKDEYYGEVNVSSVRYPSDFVPYKPKTDLVISATTWAPDGKPASSWLAGVRFTSADGIVSEKVLRVFGPRFWIPKWKRSLSEEEKLNWRKYKNLFLGWELSEAKPITKLPIRYEFAYGGELSKDADGIPVREAFESNPIGRGYIDPHWSDHTAPVPAPQIEDPDDPITDPYRQYAPQGFGPIPPAWLPRRPLGGTYDEAWIANGGNCWPEDYDFEFHNSCSPSLRAQGHIHSDLKIELVNLHPSKQNWCIDFKDMSPICFLEHENLDPKFLRMNLDSLFLEVDEENLEDPRAFCTWRLLFHPTETLGIKLFLPEDDLSQKHLEAIELPPTPADVCVAMPQNIGEQD
ncbi:DUF2169 domain-containing protein [Pseudovibrio denitrificans]|uniref:DUF2169 family type VI secretion system accessory protein n=1 Tax=Pseudovibrio denitrificans TaxID=258256 RepID=UPI0039BF3B91